MLATGTKVRREQDGLSGRALRSSIGESQVIGGRDSRFLRRLLPKATAITKPAAAEQRRTCQGPAVDASNTQRAPTATSELHARQASSGARSWPRTCPTPPVAGQPPPTRGTSCTRDNRGRARRGNGKGVVWALTRALAHFHVKAQNEACSHLAGPRLKCRIISSGI